MLTIDMTKAAEIADDLAEMHHPRSVRIGDVTNDNGSRTFRYQATTVTDYLFDVTVAESYIEVKPTADPEYAEIFYCWDCGALNIGNKADGCFEGCDPRCGFSPVPVWQRNPVPAAYFLGEMRRQDEAYRVKQFGTKING